MVVDIRNSSLNFRYIFIPCSCCIVHNHCCLLVLFNSKLFNNAVGKVSWLHSIIWNSACQKVIQECWTLEWSWYAFHIWLNKTLLLPMLRICLYMHTLIWLKVFNTHLYPYILKRLMIKILPLTHSPNHQTPLQVMGYTSTLVHHY